VFVGTICCHTVFRSTTIVVGVSVLSPYLFTRYIRALIASTISSRIGCDIGGNFVDDTTLLAPSWTATQALLGTLDLRIIDIDLAFNAIKTFCTVLNPKWRKNIVSQQFHSCVILIRLFNMFCSFTILAILLITN
jgi:hypothetical protein